MMQPNPMHYQQYQTTQDLYPVFRGVVVEPQIQPYGQGRMKSMYVYAITGQLFLETAPLEKPWADHYAIYCQARGEANCAEHATICQVELSAEKLPYQCSLCERKSASLKRPQTSFTSLPQ